MEFTANQKLDSILMALQNQIVPLNLDDIGNLTDANYRIVDFNELQQAIKRIEKDGYIESINITNIDLATGNKEAEFNYKITFDGKLFIENGGYVNKDKVEKLKAKSIETYQSVKNRNDILLIAGTILAALFAGGLLFLEIYRTFYLSPCK